jgi:DNA-binding transcriptional LysR family regulator
MNLTQIDAFCAVAETGSVSEAARQLDVNRSRLSMAIKALEQSLNAELFYRTGNRLTLSEIGKAVYKDFESISVTAGLRVMMRSPINFGRTGRTS